MKWMKFTIKTTTEATDFVSAMLAENGIEGVEIEDNVPLTKEEEASMFTDIPALLPEDDGTAFVHFYIDPDSRVLPIENEAGERIHFSTGSSLRDARMESGSEGYLFETKEALISTLEAGLAELTCFTDIGEGSITLSFTEDRDWLNNWKTFFKPAAITEDIIVKPSWEQLSCDDAAGKTIIDIDPGTAFGTGTHETTRLIITALEKYLQPGMEVMDAGCGSGIVSIAAAKLGAGHVLALDIDTAAVTATMENRELNHIDAKLLSTYPGNLLEPATLPEFLQGNTPKQFDIVAANILADVIIALSDQVAEYLKQGGLFLSCGILAEKAEDVRLALSKNQFAVLEEITLGEWICFAAKRNG